MLHLHDLSITTACAALSRALSLAKSEGYADVHILHSNRSAAHARLQDHEAALADANQCIALRSDWPKGYRCAAPSTARPYCSLRGRNLRADEAMEPFRSTMQQS